MLSTVFFNQSLNSTLIEALMVSTSNYEMRGSLFLGIDASFNLKFRIAKKALDGGSKAYLRGAGEGRTLVHTEILSAFYMFSFVWFVGVGCGPKLPSHPLALKLHSDVLATPALSPIYLHHLFVGLGATAAG